jgi:hypothetical protein
MARVAGQIAARGASTWLVRVYLGRAIRRRGLASTTTRPFHGPFREAQQLSQSQASATG